MIHDLIIFEWLLKDHTEEWMLKNQLAITGINYVLNAALVNRRDFFQKY